MIHTQRYRATQAIHAPKITAAFLYGVAAVLLLLALSLPWWRFNMIAPQYPYGLHVTTWFFGVTGDVHEVDELNHYIGFMPLAQLAGTERHLAFLAGPLGLALLAMAAVLKAKWRWLLALPAISLPVFFVADLASWLRYAGHHLDPHAALSGAVAPWTPNLFGAGGVGQFHTLAVFEPGFYLAVLAALVAIAAALYTSRERTLA